MPQLPRSPSRDRPRDPGTRGWAGLAVLLAACCAFGLTLAAVKGDGTGWRFVVGNLSAPYAIPPLLAGRRADDAFAAAWRGVAAVTATLLGFYLWEAVVLGLVTRNGAAHVLLVAVLGVVLGAAFGVLGWRSRRRMTAILALAVATPFVVEPAVQVLPGRLGNLRGDPTALHHYPYIFAVEVVLGCLGAVLLSGSSVPGRTVPATRPGT
jgi:hypothetical protein